MLFERALPLLEHAWTYGICVRFVHPVYLDAPDKAPRDLRVPVTTSQGRIDLAISEDLARMTSDDEYRRRQESKATMERAA
eukprot:scaffold3670_cov224-Pinguiococcus_pyrenoidosus.AAC.1